MPTNTIERIAEEAKALSPEASLQLWSDRRDSARRGEFDHAIAELSEQLMTATPANLDQALLLALDALRRVFEADRVVFYESAEIRGVLGESSIHLAGARETETDATNFQARRSLSSDGGFQSGPGHAPSIDLARLADGGRGLIAGHSERA